MPGLGDLIAVLFKFVSKILSDKVLAFGALKILLVTLFTTVIPLVINNTLHKVLEIGFNFAVGQIDSSGLNLGSIDFAGLTAWILDCFQIPQCLSIICSALILKLTLKSIPLSPF